MNSDEYLNERLDTQIGWYDSKSKNNKRGYYSLRVVEIAFAAAIPFMLGYVDDATPVLKFVVGALGLVVAVIAGFLGLFQLQENWISYRTTCETLRHEKFLYLTKAKPYDGSDAFTLLVERAEQLISKENTSWLQMQRTQKKGS